MPQIGETELDAGALARSLWRKSWLLILLAAAAAAGTYYALDYVEPLYTADSSILIEERESPLTRSREQGASAPATFDESAIQSQVEVLRSREIAERVIDRLGMTRRPEFDPATRPTLLGAFLVMVGMEKSPTQATIRQRVMSGYFERLTVYPVQKSRVIAVEFVARRPELAAEVANAVAEAFVDLQQGAKRESAMAATVWLEQEIERLRTRVAEAEQAVANYRTGNELFDVGQRGGAQDGRDSSLSTQQLSELNAELARARAAKAEAEARADLVQSSLGPAGSLENSQEVLDSQLIQRLRERQVALRSQIAELSTTYLPGHPRIRSLQGQLENLEGQLRQEAQKVLAALNTAARVAAAREASLVASLDLAKGAVSRSNDQEIELRALEREAAAQRDLLESFLARYREAVARTDADYLPADARIISRAVEPRDPSYPKKAMMAVAAGLAMFLIAAAIVLLREFTTGRAFRVIGYGAPSGSGLAMDAAWRRPQPDMDAPVAASPPPTVPLRLNAAPSPAVQQASAPLPEIAPESIPSEENAGPAAPALADEVAAPEAARLDPVEPDPVPADVIAAADESAREDEAPLPEPPLLAPPAPAATREEPIAPPRSLEADDRPGTAELGDIIAGDAVRVVLFAGALGGEGAGEIAFSAARRAARSNLRLVIIDMGPRPSQSLGGGERPGLGDLLGGDAAFGEVIRRDDGSRVHVIPTGALDAQSPLRRLRIVVGALTHTYDKVIVVADRLADWPHDHVRPDLAAIVCGPETSETMRGAAYEDALAKGAGSALIVRYASEEERGERASEAA